MRYVIARFENDQRETAYRIYVTDILRGCTGRLDEVPRYCELIADATDEANVKEPKETGEEIITRICDILGTFDEIEEREEEEEA
jgi:hypothetical protein